MVFIMAGLGMHLLLSVTDDEMERLGRLYQL
jgi:hypothetical protein